MKKQKRNFARFKVADAFKELRLIRLTEWPLQAPPIELSRFYHQRLRRLTAHFNLTSSTRAKALLVDAVCEEALMAHPTLKIWPEVTLKTDQASGTLDYVAAPRRDYLENPVLCIVVARKDDFEYGLTQCLLGMNACQWNNAQAGLRQDAYGIVTNGEGWQFYRLAQAGQVFQSGVFPLTGAARLFGNLRFVFAECEENLSVFAQAA